MKKNYLLGALFCTMALHAQTNFTETFDFVTGALPSGWSALDRDGSGQSWSVMHFENFTTPLGFIGATCISQETNPDNVLVTPTISLSSTSILSYQLGTVTFSPNQAFDNHYAIYVLPAANTFTGNETPVSEGTVPTASPAFPYSVNLSGYAGQNVKIYFRHFNSPNKGPLVLDTFQVTGSGVLGTTESLYKKSTGVYPNPAADYVYIRSKANAVEVFDASGKKLPVHFDGEKADVRNLQAGSYLISIETKEGKTTEKFIKK